MPQEGMQKLTEIWNKAPRFGRAGLVAGNTILAVGLAVVVTPEPVNLVAAALLGAIVGALKVLNRDRPLLSAPLSVVAALLVSVLTFLAVKKGLPLDPLYVLVPPLVAFLPGFMLTLGMVELAYGDMVSGSSRLVAGFVQLVLLASGLAAGALFVGYRPEDLVDAAEEGASSPLALWAGVVVFGVGAYLHFSAPRKSLGWILLVLVLTLAAQQAAAHWIGKAIGGFFGMLVATPLGYLIQQRFKGPPAMVTILPGFWLLVPGALSLVSVKRMLSDSAGGTAGLTFAAFAFVSLALGALMGASLFQWVSELCGSWRLQIGRAGDYFRGGRSR